MRIPDVGSRCFLCGARADAFDTSERACDCLRREGFPESELSCYVTVLPEVSGYAVSALPSLWARSPADVLAVAAGALGDEARAAPVPGDDGCAFTVQAENLLERRHHLRCGNATVYRSRGLEDLTGSELVLVLDMASYYWSGTLKDPRSWAIVNTALACGITDIAVWTAGNAGISLARLAYFANRALPPESRLQVHAIVDNEVAVEIRTRLRVWQCEVLDLFRQDSPVLDPGEIRGLVAGRLRRSRRRFDEASYWHVTDGWDGVGLMTYRWIAAQVVRDLQSVLFSEGHHEPVDILLPVGTGDLLVGFYLGVRDCENAGMIRPGCWRLIGVLPAGANILTNVRERCIPARVDGERASSAGHHPVTPKLNALYTPLAPCLTKMATEQSVHFIEISQADQLRAGRQLLSGGIDDGIAAEPSALAAFAAVPHLHVSPNGGRSGRERSYNSSRRILIVNSGLGILGRSEETFLHAALGSSAV